MSVKLPIRVLCVDPNITWDSPSMKGFLSALPHLNANGFVFELLCLRCDVSPESAIIRRLPSAAFLGPLENVWFVLCANLYFIARVLLHGWPAQVIYTSGAYCLFADTVHIHFDSAEWLSSQSQLDGLSWKERWRRLLTHLGAALEQLSNKSPWGRHCIAVSEGLAESLKLKLSAGKTIHVLPNSFDRSRFHPGVRVQWREDIRQQLNLGKNSFTFVFVATGHLQRKGFWSALRVLKRLRDQGYHELTLLIVGGSESLWKRHQNRLSEIAPDYSTWIALVPYVREIERYYAAADAFILPSRFETFALVAQEALACGLAIFVTAYWGHEIYLREGDNGWLLPWEEDGMVAKITDALEQRPWPPLTVQTHLIDSETYAEQLSQMLKKAAQT